MPSRNETEKEKKTVQGKNWNAWKKRKTKKTKTVKGKTEIPDRKGKEK